MLVLMLMLMFMLSVVRYNTTQIMFRHDGGEHYLLAIAIAIDVHHNTCSVSQQPFRWRVYLNNHSCETATTHMLQCFVVTDSWFWIPQIHQTLRYFAKDAKFISEIKHLFNGEFWLVHHMKFCNGIQQYFRTRCRHTSACRLVGRPKSSITAMIASPFALSCSRRWGCFRP